MKGISLNMTDIINYSEQTFESIKHINEYGQEYWTARELQSVLEYKRWDKFLNVVDKAKKACEGSNYTVSDHFSQVGKIVKAGAASKDIGDIHLSRYACYLIAMNGDSRKEAIALAQTYFAVKTRQQELIEDYDNLSEDQKRLSVRREMKYHNARLNAAAKDAGIKTSMEYAVFTNYGYRGLYGGLNAGDIHRRKCLKKSQHILDHMGSEELAANLFRATQTEAKLRREHISDKQQANNTHYAVGKKVRQTIAELGGTMPEDLPTPDKSIKQIEREEKKRLNR